MSKFLFLSVLSVVYMLQPGPVNGQGYTICIYYSNCTATTNLGVIDLNFASATDPYSATDSLTSNNYLWKPCQDFTLHGLTAGAIQEPVGGYAQDLGVHSSASCTVNSNGYVMFYMLSATYIRTTYVTCICGSGNTLQFVDEYPTLTYNMNFESNACCPNYVPRSSSSMSAGTVILIVFFGVVVVYILFGTIFQVAIRKAQGRERLPNVSLWTSFPGLVRDGFIFTFTCGRRSGYGKI